MQGRISRSGDELARTALYEAAHSLLIRSTKWSALRSWGMQVAKRRGMARAGCGRPQAGGHLAPHVGRQVRVPLGQASCGGVKKELQFPPEEAEPMSFPWGRWAR